MTKKHKSPIKAVFLNIALPGLGLAYLGRWGYAILFFVWAPLRLALGVAIISTISIDPPGTLEAILKIALYYVWWLFVMYDICKTPYDLAEENNQKILSQVPQTQEVKSIS